VAGLIAAPINGIGVVGVAPETKFGAMTVILGRVMGPIKLVAAMGGEEGAKKYLDNLMMQSFKQFSLFDVANHSWSGQLFSGLLTTEQK
jgi:hypothetical protein